MGSGGCFGHRMFGQMPLQAQHSIKATHSLCDPTCGGSTKIDDIAGYCCAFDLLKTSRLTHMHSMWHTTFNLKLEKAAAIAMTSHAFQI